MHRAIALTVKTLWDMRLEIYLTMWPKESALLPGVLHSICIGFVGYRLPFDLVRTFLTTLDSFIFDETFETPAH